MMTYSGPMKIYVDGVEMGEVTDVTFDTGDPDGDETVELDVEVGPDEETAFLALAMFRRRMRADAERLGEGRDDDIEAVFARMWRRAQSGAVPFRWTCRDCGLHVEDGPRQDGSEDSRWHTVPFTGGRCGPLVYDPADPALRKVYDECMAEANLVVRECEDLTVADYPGTLSTWLVDRDDPVHPCTPLSQQPEGIAEDAVNPPCFTFDGVPAPERSIALGDVGKGDRVPGAYLEVSFTGTLQHPEAGLGPELTERLAVVAFLRREEADLRTMADRCGDPPTVTQYERAANALAMRAETIQRGQHIPPVASRIYDRAAADDQVDALMSALRAWGPEVASGEELDRIAESIGMTSRHTTTFDQLRARQLAQVKDALENTPKVTAVVRAGPPDDGTNLPMRNSPSDLAAWAEQLASFGKDRRPL